MTYLLDSDILIYFFNQVEPGYELVSSLLTKKHPIAISVLSVMEARAGWSEEQKAQYLPVLYDLFPVEPVTVEIAERAGQFRYEAKQQGQRKPRPVDAVIAATAVEHNFCLVTNNLKDYTMPELKLYRDLFSK